MLDQRSDPSQPTKSQVEEPVERPADAFLSLRDARDAAVRAAQEAVYNTTRLTRLLTILSEPAPFEKLLGRLLDLLSELFLADIVVLIDPAGTGNYVPLASIGIPEYLSHEKFSDDSDSYITAAMRTKMPIMVSNVSQDPHIDSQLRELDVETAVWLPVLSSSTARGVLILARCRSIPFGHSDIDLLTAMAYRMGLALDQAHHSYQIEQIVRTGREIGRHLDEFTICNKAAQMFPATVGAQASALILASSTSECNCISQFGIDPQFTSIWCQIAGWLLNDRGFMNGEPYSTPDLHEMFNVSLTVCPARALLAVPIRIEDRVEAILFAMRFSTIAFNSDSLQIALLFAGQISTGLENARLYRAVRDELLERNRAEQALRAKDERFSAMIRSVSDVIAILSEDGSVNYASPAVETVWGCPVEKLIGQPILNHVHDDDVELMKNLLSSVKERHNDTQTSFIRIRQGSDTWRVFDIILTNLLNEPAISGIIATFHDITERKIYEQELTKLAYRDSLTGLANRTFFQEKLRRSLELADAVGQSVALVFFDLDNFKLVNDSMGHDKGDAVLKIIADRMRSCLRREDTAARLGGDEFTVLIENFSQMDQVISIVNRMMNTLRVPVLVNDLEFYVGCSIGIAISTPNHDNPEELLRKADLAMYEAKAKGKGRYVIFDQNMNEPVMERLEREAELRQALQRKEFRVYYQPVLSLENHQVVEVEALIRWEHPRRGLISPVEIIPLAEETGLIIEIGQWVLDESCRQMCSWHKKYPGLSSLSLSVNLSARQFQDSGLVEFIREVILESGINPSNVILEITESSLIQDPGVMISKLRALKDIGVRLAIDDFGTGYASLSYLRQFPVDILKIDRSFVQGIVHDMRDRAIVQSLINLATAFGLDITGEGIETEGQAAQLHSLGCNHAQGFLFSPPLSPDDFEKLFKENQ